MRIESVKREVSSSSMARKASATIKATPKIFDMFANDTYANKPVAIMRELVANGVDAHTAAGCPERPVEVTLPTSLDPTCMIKDFGIGMSQLFILGDDVTPSKFMAYTDGSTKDGNDDQIGGFGIGSKSPFAYVDQFTLRVVHDGVLSVYSMYKDETGIPAIGLQAETATTEHNGVEVSFPVEEADIQSFRDAAQDALQYFDPMPVVHNGTIEPPNYAYRGKNWMLRERAGPLGVIMGGVRYPTDPNSFAIDLRNDQKLSPLLQYGLDLVLPIGACPVAMSREALSYTPKTTVSVRAGLQAIVDDVIATFSTIFDTCPTEWDAMAMMHREIGENHWNRSARQKLMAANARYKGQALHCEFYPKSAELGGAKLWMIDPRNRRRSNLCPNPKWEPADATFGITPGLIQHVIIDDLPDSPKSKAVRKIREYVDGLQTQDKAILVVRSYDKRHTVDYIKSVLRGCPNPVLTSTMPEPASKAATGPNAVRPKVRMFTYDGTKQAYSSRYYENLTPGTYGKSGVVEVPYATQPASGIAVVMQAFALPPDVAKFVDAGVLKWAELVFVNAGDWPKIESNFKSYDDVANDRLDALLKGRKKLCEQLAVAADPTLGSMFRLLERLKIAKITKKPVKCQTLNELIALKAKYLVTLTDSDRKLAPVVKLQMPKDIDVVDLDRRFRAETAKLRRLLDFLRGSTNTIDREILEDYL